MTSAVVFPDLGEAVDRGDVGMVERGQRLRFALEAHDAIGVCRECNRQDFERDEAVEVGVARAIHLTHAAGTERAQDFMGTEPGARDERHGRVALWRVG